LNINFHYFYQQISAISVLSAFRKIIVFKDNHFRLKRFIFDLQIYILLTAKVWSLTDYTDFQMWIPNIYNKYYKPQR